MPFFDTMGGPTSFIVVDTSVFHVKTMYDFFTACHSAYVSLCAHVRFRIALRRGVMAQHVVQIRKS